MINKKYEIGIYEKAFPGELRWDEKFEIAKDIGFDYIELSIDETDEKLARLDWNTDEKEQIIKLMLNTEISLGSMCLSGHRKYPLGSSDPIVESKGMEIMKKAINLASDLGIRTIQLAGYDVFYENGDEYTDARFRKNLVAATDMAAKKGIMLGFETMETEYMNTVEKAMNFVNEIGSPYLGIYPDSGNITNAAFARGKSVLDDMERGKGHIIAFHLKETVPGIFREVPFGTGHVPFEALIRTAWKLGVRRYVIELWYTGNEKWMDDIRFARNMIGDILDSF